MDVALLARERRNVKKYSTPTKKPRMNLLMASNIQRMMSVHARSSLQFLDSGTGISEVGEQWKMTDISRSSTYSIRGAFGEPLTPTVQGFLGPYMLRAVLVLGMRDDMYRLTRKSSHFHGIRCSDPWVWLMSRTPTTSHPSRFPNTRGWSSRRYLLTSSSQYDHHDSCPFIQHGPPSQSLGQIRIISRIHQVWSSLTTWHPLHHRPHTSWNCIQRWNNPTRDQPSPNGHTQHVQPRDT